jgi:hypothetical protein
MRIAPAITLSPEPRTVLESQARSRSLPMRVVERARIALFAASGQQDKKIAAVIVSLRRKRFPAGASAFSRWAWLARHPRFHLHFSPTSASWLNLVERFSRELTQNRLRRGIFRDLEELILAIGTYIERHNESPKPFIWTARAADILEKSKTRSSHPQ